MLLLVSFFTAIGGLIVGWILTALLGGSGVFIYFCVLVGFLIPIYSAVTSIADQVELIPKKGDMVNQAGGSTAANQAAAPTSVNGPEAPAAEKQATPTMPRKSLLKTRRPLK